MNMQEGMYYDDDYFSKQKAVGEFGGKANLFKFDKYIKPNDTVIDFGCGGGYLLKNIVAANKVGIEINAVARKYALEQNSINAFASIDEVPDDIADVIISNHALEHTYFPLEILVKLNLKLKRNGKIVFVVPFERGFKKFKRQDTDRHLYTWNKQTLGNLFCEAGFQVLEVNEIKHTWPPRIYRKIYDLFGKNIFCFVCKVYNFLSGRKQTQIRIVGIK